MGVIDTLSAGYAAVNRCLWLLGIPITLGLVFWAGPRLGLDRFTTTIAIILIISVGILMVWQPLGVLVGIVVNAYVMTGLAATTLLFYYDRTRQTAASAAQDALPPAP